MTLPCKQAFSLVELSIVLVILGLLTGGILAGQSLIRAAELRSSVTEVQRYTSAYYAFRDKYFALPGDMVNATAFWGTAATCPGDSTHPSTSAATCNGDGNNALDNNTLMEKTRFWHHLADAGMIEGNYTGVTAGTANNYTMIIGTNVPKSKMSNVGYTAYYWASMSGDPNWPDGTYGNFLFAGANNTNDVTIGNAFKAEEVWNIDTKLDDGRPAYGKIRTKWNDTNCVSVITSTSATYALSASSVSCPYIYIF